MTGSLTVVQPATVLASSRSTRTAKDPSGPVAGADEVGVVVSSALAVCPVLPHETISNAEQATTTAHRRRSIGALRRQSPTSPMYSGRQPRHKQ